MSSPGSTRWPGLVPALAALLAAQLGACASTPGAGTAPSSEAIADMASSVTTVRQGLFRLRYRGSDGRGRVRLVLRDAGGGRFRLEASDSFGRELWSFDAEPGDSLLLDHRQRSFCRFAGELVVRAVALSELPVGTLPRLLFSELPVLPADGRELPLEGEVDFLGSDGRRWSARLEIGRPVSWTLHQDGAPLAWWIRQPDGGILSHSDGAQAVWSLTSEQRTSDPLGDLVIPGGYIPGDCE